MDKQDIGKELLKYYCRIIGTNVIRLRGGLSQEQLAKKAKVARGTIGSIESGEPISLENLIKIAEALGVNLPDLFISDDDREEISYKAKILVDKITELDSNLFRELKK